jgi:hypothetical protein
VAIVYLSLDLELPEDDVEEAEYQAQDQLEALYDELMLPAEGLEVEVKKINPSWSLSVQEFDFRLAEVDYFDAIEGWEVLYRFSIDITSADADPENGYKVDEWYTWKSWGSPMLITVYEPLHACHWTGFRMSEVSVVFSGILPMPGNPGIDWEVSKTL